MVAAGAKTLEVLMSPLAAVHLRMWQLRMSLLMTRLMEVRRFTLTKTYFEISMSI